MRLRRLALPAGVVVLLLLVAASLAIGVYDVTSDDVGASLVGITRIPRTIALLLSGCAMAACGLVMQMLTQNRFVDATTAGTTEWAALGLLATVLLWPESSLATRMVTASATAFLGTLVFMAVLRRVVHRSTLVVPIVGIMLGAVVSAVTTFVAVSTNALQLISTWFTGSFTSVVRGRYEVLWVVLVVLVVVFVVADRLTAVGLGKDVATTLGIRYEHVLLLGTALVAVAAAVTTVVVGFLPFLGIIVPNLVSMVRGDDLRGNLPWVCVVGAALVIVCDIVGRTIVMPFEVPVALVLGVLGAVAFIVLLLRTSRG